MRPSIPPRLATWLFNRLGPRNVELAGDLIEEYKSGRSAAWYWRQVLIAITVGFRTEVSSHKFLAAKAVAISWIVMYVGIFNRLLLIPDPSRHSSIVRILTTNGHGTWGVLIPLVSLVISLFSALIVGWTNRRFHRFAMLVLLISFVLSFGYTSFSYVSMLLVDSIDQPRFRPYLGYLLLRLFAQIAGIFLGGLLSAPTRASLPPAEID